jgi:hypothetical protein
MDINDFLAECPKPGELVTVNGIELQRFVQNMRQEISNLRYENKVLKDIVDVANHRADTYKEKIKALSDPLQHVTFDVKA